MKVLLDSCIWPGARDQIVAAGIVRLVGARHTEQAALCVELLELHGAELAQGAIVTAEPGRVRIRSAGTGEREP